MESRGLQHYPAVQRIRPFSFALKALGTIWTSSHVLYLVHKYLKNNIMLSLIVVVAILLVFALLYVFSPSTPDTAGDPSMPDTAGASSTPDTAGASSTPDTAGDPSTPDTAGDLKGYEAHDPGEFVGFLIFSIFTLDIYAAYDAWKRKRLDTNLLRSINTKLDQVSISGNLPAGNP